jgi:hypothetical protein
VRYHGLATPYFDYLMVSPDEMRRVIADSGWHIAGLLPPDGPTYIAVLEKDVPVAPELQA